jgi:hypothetical protein
MTERQKHGRILGWALAARVILAITAFVSGASAWPAVRVFATAGETPEDKLPSAAASQSPTPTQPASSTTPLPRGKKLMLKDGSFQLVREYKLDGDRVRYYSIEQSQWEEMPESLVDWDATHKIEAAEAKRDAEVVAKVHARESGRTAAVLDIDASLEVAPGVFLPAGEGLFAFDGKAIVPIPQAPADIKFSKKQMLKQVLIPVPIVPTRHTVSLIGPRAKLRIKTGQTEFYMRTADGREPELQLLRAKVKNDSRYLENLDQLFRQQGVTGETVLLMQRWLIAPGVYRFTLEQHMDPGEYALAEIVQGGGTNLYFWDFGMDPAPSESPAKASK